MPAAVREDFVDQIRGPVQHLWMSTKSGCGMHITLDPWRLPGQAIDLQKSILENYELENRSQELMRLASLEKGNKRYQDAIRHVEEAAEYESQNEAKLWRLSYRAWYVQLEQGEQAGIQAYQELADLAAFVKTIR